MPIMKQKSIKPATNVPFSEGILVHNATGSTIPADRLVTFYLGASTGKQGALMKIQLTPAATLATKGYPLLITKHAIPAGKAGVVLPWKTATGLNTSALGIGAPVYLSNVTDGIMKISAVAPTHKRIVGVVTVVSAAAGEVFVAPTMMLSLSSIN